MVKDRIVARLSASAAMLAKRDSPLVGPYLAIGRKIANTLVDFPTRIRTIEDAEIVSKCVIAEKAHGLSYSPSSYDRKRREPSAAIFPPVYAFNLRQQYVDVRCSVPFDSQKECFWVNDAFLESSRHASNEAGHLAAHGACRAILRKRFAPDPIQKGIFLGGNGSLNYYHWLLEIATKLQALPLLSAGVRHQPLLVSDRVKEIPAFAESLQILAPDHPLIYLEENCSYLIESLTLIDPFVDAPFNLRKHRRFSASDFVTRPEAVHYLRKAAFQAIASVKKTHWPERIFLGRGNRRGYNQDDIFEVAKNYGFELVYPETHSFLEQVCLFRNARYVVGPTGAAWSNLTFGTSHCRALCWMPCELGDFSSFSNLAGILGIELRYILYPTGAKSTGQIYRHSYSIGLDEFQKALESLLKSG